MASTGRSRRRIQDYRVQIMVSMNKHILVEGKDDRNILLRLLNKLSEAGIISGRFDVDTAEDLESPLAQAIGNREKVEEVCSGLGQDVAGRFVGFVDREFRGFNLSADTVTDEIAAHLVKGYLLWSRGHSIENYLLDFRTLSHAIQSSTITHEYSLALSRLERVYPDVLRLACAIGLAARDANKLGAVRDCIRWQELRLTPHVHLDQEAWISHMIEKHPKVDASALYMGIEEWEARLEACEDDIVCWLCDGHTGMAVSLAAYQRAVHEVTGDQAEAESALGAKRDKCALSGALKWAEMATAGDAVWPEELTALLTA